MVPVGAGSAERVKLIEEEVGRSAEGGEGNSGTTKGGDEGEDSHAVHGHAGQSGK